jgi:hypothetical protein
MSESNESNERKEPNFKTDDLNRYREYIVQLDELAQYVENTISISDDPITYMWSVMLNHFRDLEEYYWATAKMAELRSQDEDDDHDDDHNENEKKYD